MIDRGKRRILGVDVSVTDYAAAVDLIVDAAHEKRPFAVTALAVHGVMTGALDAEQRYRLNRFDLVTPDGQPVRWALRLLHGESLPDRVYGPQLTQRVCERAARSGLSVYLYGSTKAVLDRLAWRLATNFPGLTIAGAEPSKFRRLSAEESRQVDRRIAESCADLVLVGLGCPRQEVFVFEHVDQISRPMLAVGAAFDFHSGLLRQAPRWMQDSGLEWIFRLMTEPRRLWRRYLYLNPLYCALVGAQLAGLQLARETASEPPGKLHFG